MAYRYLFVLFFLALSTKLTAQYTFQQLDNSSGLSNSCINSISHDSDNLVWFGTWDGLNFFDGNNVHVFNYGQPDAKGSALASNVVYQAGEDRRRNIWIGTVEGVSRFDKNSGNFYNYFYSHNKAVSNGYTIAIDSRGQVYAARRNGSQLFEFNYPLNKFEPVTIQNLPDFMLLKIFFDNHDRLWLLKDNGKLEVFNQVAKQFVKVGGYAPVDSLDNVFYCNNQVFFLTQANALYGVTDNLQKQYLTTLPHQVRAMAFFNAGYVFAWSSRSIGQYDEAFRPAGTLLADVPLLQNVRVTSLTAGNDGLLWAGTDGDGVIKIAKKETQFGLMQKLANGQSFHIPVRAFCEVNGELWIGTKGNGIIALKDWNKKGLTYSDIQSFHTNVDLLDNCVYAIEKARDGLVYIGSDAQGITLYDPRQRKFIKWGDIAGSSRYPQFGSVHCIYIDADGSAWLGLNEGGLVHLKLETTGGRKPRLAYVNQYKYDGVSPGPGNNVIYSIAGGNAGRIWIGCRYGGLTVFDKATRRFRTLKAFSYPGSLSNNDILSLYLDHADRLWIGTSFGLNWTDEHKAAASLTPQFSKLYADDGLPNNTIHAINADAKGNIWISTNKGLAKIDPTSRNVVQYKESDGLQSDEFSDNATWQNSDGMLFFGGIYGFNFFVPDAIHSNADQPPLLLNDLQLAGKTSPEKGLDVLKRSGPVSQRHFILAPGDNYFELNLQPVTYMHQQKCQFASFLSGNDRNWHYMGNQPRLVYNNIPPGSYTLMVRWSNGEGTWTRPVPAFSITIRQYFWLTLPAFCLYGLVLMAALYAWFSYRRKKFVMAQQLRVEHMLREKDEVIHQEQLNFFTNIAHELQTPLTLIGGALERYLFKNKNAENVPGGNFLSIVKQEASRLQYLVQQLMEFRKAGAGRLETHYNGVDASMLLNDIASLFVALVDEKRLDFSWQIDSSMQVVTDRDKLEKIVFNLLSNAFKHSSAGQYIIFSAHLLKPESHLEITVANSGCALTAAETERLFDRFFTLDGKDNHKNSTGIGLAFTRQLVELLGGTVDVSCKDGWISFRVILPVECSIMEDLTMAGQETEKASYLVKAMTRPPAVIASTDNQNKKTLIKSFEEKGKQAILVVEDDQLIRFLLRDMLTEKYIVYESATGMEALELMKRVIPDLVISDVMMPDMDGLELCTIVKNTTETCHIPFIILSARSAIEHQTEGYGCGADAYIPKPFQTEHLLVRVNKLLEYRQKLHQAFTLNHSTNDLTAPDVNDNDRSLIEKITRLIEENIDNELDSAFLELALHMSKIQVYRKIKSLSGMTPTELVRHVRLQKASGLLLNTDLTVSEVFYRTGFNNKTYFYREFKKVYNCSPNDYRSFHRLPHFDKP